MGQGDWIKEKEEKYGLVHAKDAVCVACNNGAGEFTDLVVAPEHGAELDAAGVAVDLGGRPVVVAGGIVNEIGM